MKIGLTYPQTEFGNDTAAIRDYAQSAEELGFTHILAYDHVLGANPERPGGWRGPYTHESSFMEPFVLFAYMAALTQKIEFVSGIIILPQRQTVLVAKQAATLDVLSGGRYRMGVGIGWNEVEFVALNRDFHNRGRRSEDQVALLRKLWSEPLVQYESEWHTIPDAGLNPMPLQRPIPIWFGGHADAVLRRTARIGDGWMPMHRAADRAQPALDKLDQYLEEAGRTRADIGIEARMGYHDGDNDIWQQTIEGWKSVGGTHITLNTMGNGFDSPQAHMDAIRNFADGTGLSG